MPVAPTTAIDMHRRRTIIPGEMTSADLRALAPEILRRSLVSARIINFNHLAELNDIIGSILHPAPGERIHPDTGRAITEGESYLTGIRKIQSYLASTGYEPETGEAGTIKDFSSDQRIKLQLKTNTETAQGYGQMMQGQDDKILYAFPCQELFRAEERKEHRDWGQRWLDAARKAEDGIAARVYIRTGRMIARKDSKIWEGLGNIADDSLGNPYPPFAFKSGMWVKDISRAEAIQLEIIEPDTEVQPIKLPDLNEGLQFSTRKVDPNWTVLNALMKDLGPAWQRDADGVIRRAA